MTIAEIRLTASKLEAEIELPLQAASKKYFSQPCHPREKSWQNAYAELTFWTDARNGLRQAQDALHALEIMEKGGDWN